MKDLTLAKLPLQAKWLITLMLASFLMTHLFAGLLVWQVTTQANGSAREFFAVKGFATLLRMAHQHTFGHGTMYFLTSAVFLLARPRDVVAIPLMTGAFVGAWLDHVSWFLLKYSSGDWEILSRICGATYTACFLAMACIALYRMWARPRPAR